GLSSDSTFTNQGTVNVSNGDRIHIQSTNFSNAAAGTIAVGANSEAYIAPDNSWSNAGLITLASGAKLHVGGNFSAAGLGSITNSGGQILIEGTFDNTGNTLDGTGFMAQAVLNGGTVHSGTVTSAGLVFSTNGGTLDGVTYKGPLDLSATSTSVHIANGL